MTRRIISALLVLVSVAVAFPARAAASPSSALPPSPVIAAYSLAAPTPTAASGLVVRAIIAEGGRCPSLDVIGDGGRRVAVRMVERPRPALTEPAFDALTVCSAVMPVAASSATVAGRPVPSSMPARIARLAMLGDSGCRIASWQVQDCSDEAQWPLARISTAIAADQPDAIVINGDYFYREAPCPPTDQSWCGSSPPPVTGMPFTDSAYGWIADVFVPMAPLLAAAPLIVVRGNHEACNRAGNGYFWFLDPRPGTAGTCAPSVVDGVLTAAPTVPSPTYAIDLAVGPRRTLRLAVADSAGGNDAVVDSYAAVQRPAYERAAGLTQPRPGRESWLLTHRPLYGYFTTEFAVPGTPFDPWSSADQAAAAWGLLDSYSMVFSSHLHHAQVVQLPGLPPQLVLGNGGTLLDPTTGYPLPTTGQQAGDGRLYPVPTYAWNAVRFGYAIAEPLAQPGDWRLWMRDPSGEDFARCGLRAREMYCQEQATSPRTR